MKCRLCGKDTASVKYDRIIDRFYVDCTECESYVVYTQCTTKEEVEAKYLESVPDKKKARK